MFRCGRILVEVSTMLRVIGTDPTLVLLRIFRLDWKNESRHLYLI